MLVKMDQDFDISDFGGDGVLYFSADWCGPCKVLSPALSSLAEEEAYEDFNFFQIPSESNQEMYEKFSITSHPVIILMKSGRKVAQFNGVMDMENGAEKDIQRLRKLIKTLYRV